VSLRTGLGGNPVARQREASRREWLDLDALDAAGKNIVLLQIFGMEQFQTDVAEVAAFRVLRGRLVWAHGPGIGGTPAFAH
jgi:hypothetical protein